MSARDGQRISIATSLYSLDLGAVETCRRCGTPIQLKEIRSQWPAGEKVLRCWSDCPCIGIAISRDQALSLMSGSYQADQRSEIIADPVPIRQFTFETFDPMRIANGARLLWKVKTWLETIGEHTIAPAYGDKPTHALYFYSAGKGRGKTHLAAAIVNQVRATGRRAVLVDEMDYIESYWAASFEDKKRLSDLPGTRAWLTVLDDVGQRESTTAGLRDAWYDVINARWLKRGWLVITSNWTPDQLRDNGTINDATYSRLAQMTQGTMIQFDGSDQRLTYGEAAI